MQNIRPLLTATRQSIQSVEEFHRATEGAFETDLQHAEPTGKQLI